MAEEISEVEKLNAALDKLQSEIRTTLPAIVVTYNKVTNRATVKLTRRNKGPDGTLFGPTEIPDLPVGWWRFNGISIRGELKKGDEVKLSVCDRSIAEWFTSGQVSDPEWTWMHNLSDAFVEPCFQSATNLPPGGNGVLYIGRDDGLATLKIKFAGPGEIELEALTIKAGATATQGPALSTSLATFLAAAATTAAAAAAGGDGGLAAFGSFSTSMAGLVAAAGAVKLKAE